MSHLLLSHASHLFAFPRKNPVKKQVPRAFVSFLPYPSNRHVYCMYIEHKDKNNGKYINS